MQIKELTIEEYFRQRINGEGSVKPIVIYGVSQHSKYIAQRFQQENLSIAYFCDKNELKAGQKERGILILTPMQLVEKTKDFDLVLGIEANGERLEQICHYIEENIFKYFSVVNEKMIYRITLQERKIYENIDEYLQMNLDKLASCYSGVKNFSFYYVKKLYDTWGELEIQNGVLKTRDRVTEFMNYKDGIRKTCYQPKKAKHKCYIIGDSRAACYRVEDKHTIASFLQEQISSDYFVINMGANMFSIDTFLEQIKMLSIQKGDVVIFSSRIVFTAFESGNYEIEKYASQLFVRYLQQMNKECVQKGAYFFYLDIPCINRINNPSDMEKELFTKVIKNKGNIVQGDKNDYLMSSRKLIRLNEEEVKNLLEIYAIPHISFVHTFSRPHSYGEVYIDSLHLSPKGNKVVADTITKKVSVLTRLADDKKLQDLSLLHRKQFHNMLSKNYDVDMFEAYANYLKQYKVEDTQKNGSIVMNCNPFTRGHQYIIEYAAKQVDMLYIFVVEENKSHFPFEDRYRLVKEGTEHLKNVCVLRSGKFIISSLTFPEYFTKESSEVSKQKISCFDDLFIFGYKIAPILNIKIRFAGEEPYCPLTRQYNQQMERMLEEYDISFKEIPRLNQSEDAISASKVRKLLEKKEFEEIEKLVPVSTLNYLKEFHSM